MRTGELVQRLQITRRELGLESAITKLAKHHLLVLDDIAYVSKDRAETSVLFELIGSRYERPLIADRSQSALRRVGQGVPRPGHDLAAIDRLMHYATILEMNVESYRGGAALNRKCGPGWPPAYATRKESA